MARLFHVQGTMHIGSSNVTYLKNGQSRGTIWICVKFSLVLSTLHTFLNQLKSMLYGGYHLIKSFHFRGACWNKKGVKHSWP